MIFPLQVEESRCNTLPMGRNPRAGYDTLHRKDYRKLLGSIGGSWSRVVRMCQRCADGKLDYKAFRTEIKKKEKHSSMRRTSKVAVPPSHR